MGLGPYFTVNLKLKVAAVSANRVHKDKENSYYFHGYFDIETVLILCDVFKLNSVN